MGVTDEEREIRREEILSTRSAFPSLSVWFNRKSSADSRPVTIHYMFRLKDFKDFADVVETVKDKGVVVVVASPEDVSAANEEKSGFFDVKKVL